jgi:hypothetical protein
MSSLSESANLIVEATRQLVAVLRFVPTSAALMNILKSLVETSVRILIVRLNVSIASD